MVEEREFASEVGVGIEAVDRVMRKAMAAEKKLWSLVVERTCRTDSGSGVSMLVDVGAEREA